LKPYARILSKAVVLATLVITSAAGAWAQTKPSCTLSLAAAMVAIQMAPSFPTAMATFTAQLAAAARARFAADAAPSSSWSEAPTEPGRTMFFTVLAH